MNGESKSEPCFSSRSRTCRLSLGGISSPVKGTHQTHALIKTKQQTGLCKSGINTHLASVYHLIPPYFSCPDMVYFSRKIHRVLKGFFPQFSKGRDLGLNLCLPKKRCDLKSFLGGYEIYCEMNLELTLHIPSENNPRRYRMQQPLG